MTAGQYGSAAILLIFRNIPHLNTKILVFLYLFFCALNCCFLRQFWTQKAYSTIPCPLDTKSLTKGWYLKIYANIPDKSEGTAVHIFPSLCGPVIVWIPMQNWPALDWVKGGVLAPPVFHHCIACFASLPCI